MPDAIIIGGANGAGKTTFARLLLPAYYPLAEFINADEISQEHPDFAGPVASGREFLRRLESRVNTFEDFAVETTLASRMYAQRIPRWHKLGYRVVLHFLEVPSADFSVKRVANRVARGGHDIPEADIRHRYQRGLSLFESTYRDMADKWYHWRTDEGSLNLAAKGERETT